MKILFSLLLVLLFSSCQKVSPITENQHSVWKPYSKEAVVESIANKKPVVIDFYADWCPNCHVLEKHVFSRPEIQAQLAHVTALRADVSNQEDDHVQEIIQEYELQGVPIIVFLDNQGQEKQRLLGLVTPKEFIEALNS